MAGSRPKKNKSSRMKQGQGNGTVKKEDDLYLLFMMILGMTTNSEFDYWHLDCTCGPPQNAIVGCPGSSLVFSRAVLKSGKRQIKAAFCDNDPDAIAELRKREAELPPGSLICCKDNGIFLREIAERIRAEEPRPEKAWGSALIDPNRWKALPINPLAELMAEFRKIDLIMNLNRSLFEMFEGCKRSQSKKIRQRHLDKPTMTELLARFNKDYWFIRNPVGNGHRFVLLLGHNHEERSHKKFKDFFPLESKEGQSILLDGRRQYSAQLDLFEDRI